MHSMFLTAIYVQAAYSHIGHRPQLLFGFSNDVGVCRNGNHASSKDAENSLQKAVVNDHHVFLGGEWRHCSLFDHYGRSGRALEQLVSFGGSCLAGLFLLKDSASRQLLF